MFNKIIRQEGTQFYKVTEESVARAEEELGIIFPEELKKFYLEMGYGFLHSEEGNFNRIMDPNSLCEFRFRQGQFANDSELEIYESYERDKLIFFEICEGVYLAIGFSKNNNGKIYYGKDMIADSLEEFLLNYQENEKFFV